MSTYTNNVNIYEYLDYKKFLTAKIKEGSKVRGFQTRMAKTAKCQKSYLSQVLRTKYHITTDQAFRLTQFFNFSALETDYFIELVNFARTDLAPLKERILVRLTSIKESSTNLRIRP